MVSNLRIKPIDKTPIRITISIKWGGTEERYVEDDIIGEDIREETQEEMFDWLKKAWASVRNGYRYSKV